MKFLTPLLFSVLFTAVQVEAQTTKYKFRRNYKRKYDTGLMLAGGVGLSFLNSDNRSKSDGTNSLGNNGLGRNVHVGLLYKLTPKVSVLGCLDYHQFETAKGINFDQTNNVAFRSHLYQASGAVLYNILDRSHAVVPFVKAGFGAASYTASSYRTGDGGKEIKLSALRGYPAIAAVVPVGAGLDFQLSNTVSIAPEVTFNLTSNDYLDNRPVEAGYVGKNDHFVNALLKVYYKPDTRRKKFKRRRW